MAKTLEVLLAAAGGFIAGVLLAPKSGKETRQDLYEKKNEYKAKANESIDTIKKGASSIKNELKSSGDHIKNIAEDTTESVKRTAR